MEVNSHEAKVRVIVTGIESKRDLEFNAEVEEFCHGHLVLRSYDLKAHHKFLKLCQLDSHIGSKESVLKFNPQINDVDTFAIYWRTSHYILYRSSKHVLDEVIEDLDSLHVDNQLTEMPPRVIRLEWTPRIKLKPELDW